MSPSNIKIFLSLPNFLRSFKSFGNFSDNLYTKFMMLEINSRFICVDSNFNGNNKLPKWLIVGLHKPPSQNNSLFCWTFDKNRYNDDLKSKLDSIEKLDYPLFESIFIDVLNTHAPVATKRVRANNQQFMTKALRKAIMTTSRLKNAYLKTWNFKCKNWENYKEQRNFCTNLLKKTKSEYFRNLNIKDLNSNKKFWKKIKPFFSEKGLETNNIILKEKNELITNSSTLANLFNNYFINITSTLKLKQSPPKFPSIPNLLIHYRDHMSIKKIKETYKITDKFHLKEVSSEEVKKVIKSLNKKKSAISSCIPVKVLIDSVDTYLPIFTDIINSSIRNGTFPEELKLAEVTPLFEKADPFDEVNYKPLSLLSHV